MLQEINIERYLEKYSAEIEEVTCGGETGEDARELDYAWVIGMHLQCVKYDVPFRFRRTGTHFRRGGKLYTIEKEEQESYIRYYNTERIQRKMHLMTPAEFHDHFDAAA